MFLWKSHMISKLDQIWQNWKWCWPIFLILFVCWLFLSKSHQTSEGISKFDRNFHKNHMTFLRDFLTIGYILKSFRMLPAKICSIFFHKGWGRLKRVGRIPSWFPFRISLQNLPKTFAQLSRKFWVTLKFDQMISVGHNLSLSIFMNVASNF